MLPTPSLSFVICSEGGGLECKSLLFVRSLRKFGGKYKNAPVLSLSPRKGYDISTKVAREFKNLGVDHRSIPLNIAHRDIPFANKIHAAAFAEVELRSDIIVFADSDQVVLNPPSLLSLNAQTSAAARVVAKKGIGSNGQDENAPYWRALYKLLGCQKRPLIELTSGQRILEYYNAGLVAVRREEKIFRQWQENLRVVLGSSLKITEPFFLEQSLLSATLTQKNAVVRQLPLEYNCPIFNSFDFEKLVRNQGFDDLCTLHFHRTFDPPRSIARSGIPHDLFTARMQWLECTLKECGVNPKPFGDTNALKKQFSPETINLLKKVLKTRRDQSS